MGSDKITIYDIAAKLNISVSTVSRVMNNSQLVGDDKTRLIQETATQMGYEKRQIKRHRKRTILNIVLILPYRKDPYMHLFYDAAQLIKGIEDGFGDTRISIIIDLDIGKGKIFSHKKTGNIDGVIFAFSDPQESLLEILGSRKIPFVFLNRMKKNHNYICCDHKSGMLLLVKNLVEKRNAEKLIFIGLTSAIGVLEEREAGFREACAKFNLSANVQIISSIDEVDSDYIDKLHIRNKDAILCCNDYLGITFYQALLHKSIRIPEDVALTGFDNSPIRDLFWDKLTTIDLSTDQLGKDAAFWLKNRIVNRDESMIQELITGEFIPGTTI
ncbi:MAG: LacI family DNA-binding transcriptional regulator [Spirochaetia bacterium]|jgi:LacI family transcriptional regulator|nr:LacI family DNA-binding transcriptional regulator [Spirochaetia bacterium]